MTSQLNKSSSETEIDRMATDDNRTPPNFVCQRSKRGRDDVFISERLDDLKKEMKDMLAFMLTQKIQEITSTLKEIQQTNLNIENTVTHLMSQNQVLENKISLLEKQSKEDKKYIKLLENKVEEMETGSRKANFVIKNVPKLAGETKEELIGLVMTLSKGLDCLLTKSDIKDIYRVRGKNDSQNTPIVVETGSTLIKNEILKKGKSFNKKQKSKLCCKHLGFKSQEDTPVFLSEHLTAKGSRLYFLARDLIKSGEYKYCWTAYGKVYIRKDDHAAIITIRSEEQIHQLIVKN
ncbi:hypothetical protein PYW08_012954 [Mythimna loreyi]|uniref:Uncharacterized protein n=1 Tax=Mythimna loreyi TaxID=667449 RepID=A0ACC2Q126_9NEOP|nr:hypothetical protein PYW08_012954 [Mythimna loreyi]